MKALLTQLCMPPVLVAFPWLLALVRRQWLRFGLLLLIWISALALMMFKWSGAGALLLTALGLGTAMTSTIQIRE